MTEILLLCTANICRSPMAAALLALELPSLPDPGPDGPGPDQVVVRSAGRLGSGVPPPAEVMAVMAGYGLDLTAHRSRQLTASDLAAADLILAMSRENLRHAVVLAPQAWPRAFTIRELLRLGGRAGRQLPGETLADWLARVSAGRSRLALLGDSSQDDVADPIGGPRSAYERTAAELRELARQLTSLCWSWPASVK
jgi:protein-tyrosine phosphatase